MNTKTFNENFELDRKAKGIRANAKNALAPEPEIQTAGGMIYDSNETYYFFDESTKEIRQSTGLRRHKEYLSTFGLRVVEIGKLHSKRDDALTDGQTFFRSEIERLNARVKEFELEKTTGARSLKSFLMAKE